MDENHKVSNNNIEINNEKKFPNNVRCSDSYDEVQFIDDWVHYAKMYIEKRENKLDDSHPFTESHQNKEEVSFTSVMDLYMSESVKYSASSEELDALSWRSTFETIDLCDKPNLATVQITSSQSFNESENDESNETESKGELEVPKHTKKIEVCLKSAISQDQSSIRINRVQHPTLVNIKSHDRSVCSKQVRLSKHRLIMPSKNQDNTQLGRSDLPLTGELTEPARIMENLREAERRTIQQNKRSVYDVPLRRFVIGTEDVQIKMKDVFTLHDFKSKVIVGELYKRGNNGYYKKNWFLLRENFFTCFNGKKIRCLPGTMPQERLGDIEHPEDPLYFLTRKYTLDLFNCRLMLSKSRKRRDIFTCYSETIPAEADLVDITDLVIFSIQECVTGYKIVLKREGSHAEVTLNCLNFCIKSNDGYRFYKMETIDEFLKWIIAFKFRLGQIELNIGI